MTRQTSCLPRSAESVLKQIDGAIADSRTVLTPERLQYRPRRRAFVLILIVNLAVVVLVAGGILAASSLLDRQEASIARDPERILSTESKVIAALKEESDQQLKRKDQEILSIAERLKQADAERQRLGSETQKQLESREGELRREYEDALRLQREELEKGGLSEAEIAVRLRRLEATNAAQLEARLADARSAAQKERESREAAIAAVVSQYQSQLQGAQAERTSLQSASAQRVAELERQLAQRAGEAERATSAIAQELQRLQQQHESERLVLEQLVSAYERSSRLIESESYAQALQSLQGIRTYLDRQNVAALPVIQQRRPVELFLVSSLEELVRSRDAADEVDTAALISRAPACLPRWRISCVRPRTRRQAGDRDRARGLYEGALARSRRPPPPTAASRGSTPSRPRTEGPRRSSSLPTATSCTARIATPLPWPRTGPRLPALVGDQRVADQVADTLQRVGYRLMAAEEVAELGRLRADRNARAELERRLGEIRRRYAAEAAARAPEAVPGMEAFAELLQTKVLFLTVLDRAEIRAAYPDLAGAVDRYLSVFGEERYEEGRQAAFAEVASLLDGVAPAPASGSAATRDPVLGILDRLVRLVQVR